MSVYSRRDLLAPSLPAPPKQPRRLVAVGTLLLSTTPALAQDWQPVPPAAPITEAAPPAGDYPAPVASEPVAPATRAEAAPVAPPRAAPVAPPSPVPVAPASAAPYPSPPPYPPPAPAPGYPPMQPYGPPPAASGQYAPRVVEPPPPEPPWPSEPEPEYRRHRLTLQTESVFSADEGPFYNHLLGGRYAYNTTRATNLGLYAGYANLKGTGERVHSVLFLGQFEYQLFFGDSGSVIVPLRVGLGYLVENGPMVRFATGAYFVVSDDLQAGMDLIAPSYWSASNDTVLSMSLSAEVSYVF